MNSEVNVFPSGTPVMDKYLVFCLCDFVYVCTREEVRCTQENNSSKLQKKTETWCK